MDDATAGAERPIALPLRELPWSDGEGRTALLRTDGTGTVARLADAVEDDMVDTATEVLRLARGLLASDAVLSPEELRGVATQLIVALTDAVRVAELREARLPMT